MNTRRKGSITALTSVCLLALACAVAGAQEQLTAPAIAPEADKVLHAVSDYYAGLQNFSADFTMTINYERGDQKRQVTAVSRLAVARPNRLLLWLESEGHAEAVVSDGAKLYKLARAPGGQPQYTVTEAPKELTEQLLPGDPFLAALVVKKPYDLLVRGMQQAQLLEPAAVGGVACRRVRLAGEDFDVDLYVSQGDRPLVQQVVRDMAKGLAPAETEKVTAVVTTTYRNWTVNAELPQDTFKFQPPKGAEEVKSFGPQPLALGAPAPDFELDLLDGGKFKLSDFKGKNIVVLDFWATWCGPCRTAMPIIIAVTNAYKDKGVVLYAVNEQEEPDRIRAFLKDQKLQCAVALDTKGTAGYRYGVEGIPFTVIIGKDGTVQAVHEGVGPDLRERLKKQLETLIAGKSLVEPGQDAPKQ